MLYDPLTPLGRALHLCLALLWPRLRADAHIPRQIPLTPKVYIRMNHALVRLYWLLARLDRLALRWQQGTLPKPRAPRPARVRQPTATPATPTRPPRMRDPSAHAWLGRIYQPALQLAGQIEHFMAHEDTRALVAATPQAGRLLRPLARMLGATIPAWLKLPPRPRKPRAPRPRTPRPRPLSLTDPSLNLQPYVIAAARAWKPKFG